MKNLRHRGGWDGGTWLIHGKAVEFGEKSKAIAVINGSSYKVFFKKIFGHDDDHGHSYNWSRVDPFIKCSDCFDIEINLKDILDKGHKVKIEVTF